MLTCVYSMGKGYGVEVSTVGAEFHIKEYIPSDGTVGGGRIDGGRELMTLLLKERTLRIRADMT